MNLRPSGYECTDGRGRWLAFIGALPDRDAFPGVQPALPYALVGARWCPSCCTTVVRGNPRTAPGSAALVGASRADTPLTTAVKQRRLVGVDRHPGAPRRRTRRRGRGAPRKLRRTHAASRRARRRSTAFCRRPPASIRPAGSAWGGEGGGGGSVRCGWLDGDGPRDAVAVGEHAEAGAPGGRRRRFDDGGASPRGVPRTG